MQKQRFILLLLLLVPVLFVLTKRAGPVEKSAAPVSFQEESSLQPEQRARAVSTTVLIEGGKPTGFQWTGRSPAAKRIREIFPDPDWMMPKPVLQAGDLITLALFDDAVFEASVRNVTVYPGGAVGMTAHLTGERNGIVYLSYSEQQMRVSVEVSGGADYYSRYDPETDSHYAIEIDPEKTITRPCGGDLLIPPDAHEHQHDASEPTAAFEPQAQGDAPAGSTIVDVMIVYTPKALSDEGGQVGMDDNIAIAMEKANETHANSGTQIYLRLVHSAEVEYVESGDDNTDLNRLTWSNDGEMDEVHDWRDEYGADFVCLFSDTALVGGLGWLMTSTGGEPGYAFCLAWSGQTDRRYTLVHEWGHNMGCSHSKDQVLQPWRFYYSLQTHSAGWQWDDAAASEGSDGFCTVMTYQNFDNDRTTGYGSNGYEYEQVAHFSNPDILYTGDSTNPTGDAVDGDNARTMREMRTVYEGYRESVFELNPDLDDDGLPNWWEEQYYGGATQAVTHAAAANGVNTVLEAYIAGINPTNPTSFFTASGTHQIRDGFVVRWAAVSGRVYSVFGSTGPGDEFQALETGILWPQSSWTDAVECSEQFYKIDVQME